MKKGCFALMILLLGCGSCSPDSLIDNLDLTQSTETQTDGNDTTTVAPKFDESVLAADSISGTTFDRTIQIVFADGGAQVYRRYQQYCNCGRQSCHSKQYDR